MNCPPAIADVLLEILGQAALRTRAAGWAGDAARAAMEADHVHNLPELLRSYSPDLLAYYWKASRPAFMAQAADAGVYIQDFETLWERLRPYVSDAAVPVVTN